VSRLDYKDLCCDEDGQTLSPRGWGRLLLPEEQQAIYAEFEEQGRPMLATALKETWGDEYPAFLHGATEPVTFVYERTWQALLQSCPAVGVLVGTNTGDQLVARNCLYGVFDRLWPLIRQRIPEQDTLPPGYVVDGFLTIRGFWNLCPGVEFELEFAWLANQLIPNAGALARAIQEHFALVGSSELPATSDSPAQALGPDALPPPEPDELGFAAVDLQGEDGKFPAVLGASMSESHRVAAEPPRPPDVADQPPRIIRGEEGIALCYELMQPQDPAEDEDPVLAALHRQLQTDLAAADTGGLFRRNPALAAILDAIGVPTLPAGSADRSSPAASRSPAPAVPDAPPRPPKPKKRHSGYGSPNRRGHQLRPYTIEEQLGWTKHGKGK
jgi:hypothetical protein